MGTSSDRIGSPKGETAYYATASKRLTDFGTGAYVSLNWSEWDEAINLPFGLSQEIGGSYAARYMYDGARSHALLDRSWDRFGVSLMWIWLEQFGVSINGGF